MQETREIRAVVVKMGLVQVASMAPRRPDAPVLYSKPKRKQSHRDSVQFDIPLESTLRDSGTRINGLLRFKRTTINDKQMTSSNPSPQ